MSFIERKDPIILNAMLTSKGREILSTGNLTFKYFAIGDGEIDYNFLREINLSIDPDFNLSGSTILMPKDKNPKIKSTIPITATGETYVPLSPLSGYSYEVITSVKSIGFFISGETEFNIDGNHVKQPDAMIFMSGITGGRSLSLKKAPTYGTSGNEPVIGDLLLVKWTLNTDTTGYTINSNSPTPFLIYQISGKTGTLGNNTLNVIVDRELPNFSGYSPTGKAGALIYYSASTTNHEYSTDYLSNSVLTFAENYQCSIEEFPFWNMSIIFTDEIAGIQAVDRKFVQFNSRTYGGFVSYIQNQMPIYKKLGVIHYSNNTPANVYGEEFYKKTPTLYIPTIMWHKSPTKTLGLTLAPTGDSKVLIGLVKALDIEYYDLADLNGNIVGKSFNGLKMFLIEDQELLFAMSYKSNRSWTLPNYDVTGGAQPCPPCPPCTDTTTISP